MARSSSRIDATAVALLGAIAERPAAQLSGAALRDYAGSAGKQLMQAGLLARVGGKAAATCMSDHDDEPVTLTRSPTDETYGYFSPSAGWVVPPQEETAVYRLRFEVLFPMLGADLDCSLAARPHELYSSLIWSIGMARIPGRSARADVWIARRLSDPRVWQAFCDLVRTRPAPGMRVVLSLSPDDAVRSKYVRGHEVVGVQSVLDYSAGLKIDPQILAARLSLPRINDAPITMMADGAAITVRGKTFECTGSKQRAIVRHLYEARESGNPSCLTANVLVAAGCGLKVNTVAKAFSGRTDWREFIKEERGRCWIYL